MRRRDIGSLQSSKRQEPAIPTPDARHHNPGSAGVAAARGILAPNLVGMNPGQDTARIPKPDFCHLISLYSCQTKADVRQQV